MNFSQMKTELFARGTNYLEEDSEGVARAELWLNQAYREILNFQAWPFLQASATGSADEGFVSVPDLRRVRFVLDASQNTSVKLGRVSLDDLVAEGEDITEAGVPAWYYVDGGNTVKSFPLGGTLKVYYFKRVDPLSGTDEPIFDEEYHNLIIDKAMIKAYIDSDNFEAAAALRQEYEVGLEAMVEDYMLDSREVQYISVNSYDG